MLPVGADQTLSVTFTPTDTANYNAATATVAITVLKTTPLITWSTPAAITYGTALSGTQLNATAPAGVTGTFAYTPASGTVLGAGVGQTLVGDLHARRHRRRMTLRPRRSRSRWRRRCRSITWPAPAAITYGTGLSGTQLNATAGMAGTWSYTPESGTLLRAGTGQTLSVTFTPANTADYSAATATVDDHRLEGDAGNHLAGAGADQLGYGARCDAVERDRAGGHDGLVGVCAAERDDAGRGRRADPLGDVHADQRRRLHRGHGDGRGHRSLADADGDDGQSQRRRHRRSHRGDHHRHRVREWRHGDVRRDRRDECGGCDRADDHGRHGRARSGSRRRRGDEPRRPAAPRGPTDSPTSLR